MVYFRSASVYIITLNRLHYFPWYKSQNHTMPMTSQDYSEWDFQKTWRSDRKKVGVISVKSGFLAFIWNKFSRTWWLHIEKTLWKPGLITLNRHLFDESQKRTIELCFYHLQRKVQTNEFQEDANICAVLGTYSTKEQKVGIVRQTCFSWSQDTISLLI